MEKHLWEMPVEQLIASEGMLCPCGKRHHTEIRYISIRPGAVNDLPEALRRVEAGRPLVVCGPNGYEAAGRRVCEILKDNDVPYTLIKIPAPETGNILPSETAVGYVALNFDESCDVILGVGSGVINDVCKVAGKMAGLPTMIVATAPSMDGYASPSSSMEVDGVKLTLAEKTPAAILCDAEILAKAPLRMIWAGVGDMLAKYTALCEWRISHLVTGEYYCEEIAGLVKASVDKVIGSARGILEREEQAVENVCEGLVLSGLGMLFAEISHPAAGLDHYFSHCWEMMSLERGQRYDLHGIQVGIGTLITLRIFEKIKALQPSTEAVEAAADRFDEAAWQEGLRGAFPRLAPKFIELEEKTGHNRREGRLKRAARILENWEEIVELISQLPSSEEIYALMQGLGMPTDPREIGYSIEDTVNAFVYSRDVRDKYLLSSFLWDMGYLEEFAGWLGEMYR